GGGAFEREGDRRQGQGGDDGDAGGEAVDAVDQVDHVDDCDQAKHGGDVAELDRRPPEVEEVDGPRGEAAEEGDREVFDGDAGRDRNHDGDDLAEQLRRGRELEDVVEE